MAVANLGNGAFSDMFNASNVMFVGGVLFLGAIFLSLSSGPLRRLYFHRPTTPAVAA